MKVILLKHTMLGNPGDEIEVSEDVGAAMCAERMSDSGYGPQPYRVAKPADEPEYVPSLDELTQEEAAALGIKNIVPSPAYTPPQAEEPMVDSAPAGEKMKSKKGK